MYRYQFASCAQLLHLTYDPRLRMLGGEISKVNFHHVLPDPLLLISHQLGPSVLAFKSWLANPDVKEENKKK